MEQENKKSKKPLLITIALFLVALTTIYIFTAKPWEKIGDVDDLETIDLTTMSSTMVYAYVNDMVNTRPDNYLGKTIKAKGQYYKSYYNATEMYYHFVIISDATVCCAQGIEFLYEREYPSENAEIIITGTFEKYDELGKTYYFINASNLTVV